MPTAQTLTFEIASRLEAPADSVWAVVSTMAGVNDELGPWLRMTHPPAISSLDAGLPLGQRLFRSYLLLFGIVPVEVDDLVLTEVVPGRGFREASTMLTMRYWGHERSLAPVDLGAPAATGSASLSEACVLRDRLTFEPRLRFFAALARPIVAWLFRHRHKRLRARFGGRPV